VTFIIITQTTVGTTRGQGEGLGPNCLGTATPKRSGSKEKIGFKTGADTMISGTGAGTKITEADDIDLLAVTATDGFSQKVHQWYLRVQDG